MRLASGSRMRSAIVLARAARDSHFLVLWGVQHSAPYRKGIELVEWRLATRAPLYDRFVPEAHSSEPPRAFTIAPAGTSSCRAPAAGVSALDCGDLARTLRAGEPLAIALPSARGPGITWLKSNVTFRCPAKARSSSVSKQPLAQGGCASPRSL
jgi:hypothetical protein